jgi:hypothetical protein
VLAAGIPKTSEGAGQSESFTCTDKAGNSASHTVSGINIDKSAPAVVSITVSPNPAPPNSPLSVTAVLADNGSGLSQANYQVNGGAFSFLASVQGDSATATGTISPSSTTVSEVCVNVADVAGNVSAASCQPVALASSGPSSGFVTGGLTFTSPAGALAADPALTGRAQMSLNAKMQGKSTTPSGNNSFNLKAADLQFSSTSLDWLMVSGARAQYKGKGSFKGVSGSFDFTVTVIDGDLPGGGGRDRIRMQISGNGRVVYDSMMGAPEWADPVTAIDGGSIVIHK